MTDKRLEQIKEFAEEENKNSPHQDIYYKWEDPRDAVFEPVERSTRVLYEDDVLLAEYVNDHVDEIVITNQSGVDIRLVFDKCLELEPVHIAADDEYAIVENNPNFGALREGLGRNMFYVEEGRDIASRSLHATNKKDKSVER